MDVPTTERLAKALEVAFNATGDARLAPLIVRARQGFYDDYRSPLECGPTQLVRDLTRLGHLGLAERARNGEFDGTPEEAAAWARSAEGVAAINEAFGIGRR